MAVRIDDHIHPGRAKYYTAMSDNWMTSKEVAFAVEADVTTVDTVLRRWESVGIIERRFREVKRGRKPIEWRWK